MLKSRAPARYFTQSGIVGSVDWDGSGSNADDGSIVSDNLVVKALTALQAL
jgi:hypothetical protein